MKNTFLILLSFFITNQIIAQSLQHNFSESISLAQSEGKNVLMIFSGSDWCKPCIALKEKVLLEEAFTNYSNQNLVLLELDFPYRKKNKLPEAQKKHNELLADKYNPDGQFPKMVLLDEQENFIAQVDYQKDMTPQQLIDKINILILENH